MKTGNLRILKDIVDRDFLPFVRKPSRYIGGEINQIRKDLSACDVKFALCFPDIYEIGTSHTGLAIIYHILNGIENVAAERVFAPWLDAEEILRKKNIPLFSLESKAAVADFDIVGLSLTNELCYTNMLNMLSLAGIGIRSADRSDDEPLIIAGGQAANCAEPVADFVDVFILGQAEEAVVQFIQIFRGCRQAGLSKKDTLLETAKNLPCAYVPAFYKFQYNGDGITCFKSAQPDLRCRIEDASIDDFENSPVPAEPIVPFTKAVHERISIEIMRGCPGRCRFCQASFCRRPVRFRSPQRIFDLAVQNYLTTGLDTISLLSLSSGDYPYLEELTEKLKNHFEPLHVGLSLPSLKVQSQLKLLPKLVSSVRKSGLTIAVEAASEKLRQIINKPISDSDLLSGIRAAYEAGFGHVKLYFMVGFPGETDADIAGIVTLSQTIASLKKEFDGTAAAVNAAVSWLVPKPHTPFAWLGQKERAYFQHAKRLILDYKRSISARTVQFKFHHIDTSILESAIARGDRRMADVIESAWRKGAKFDLWSDCFNFEIWRQAFAENGMDIDTCAQKKFSTDRILPWSHLGGPEEKYLLGHYENALGLAGSSDS